MCYNNHTATCALAGTRPPNPGQNPATWMLDITGGSMAATTAAAAAGAGSAQDWAALYARSGLAAANEAEAEKLIAEGLAGAQPLSSDGTYAQPFGVQVCAPKP
jgi:hypothetical protein